MNPIADEIVLQVTEEEYKEYDRETIIEAFNRKWWVIEMWTDTGRHGWGYCEKLYYVKFKTFVEASVT